MRVPAVVERLVDPIVAFVLTLWAESDFWQRTPAGMHVVGGRPLLAVLLPLTTLPLAVRRRAPAATTMTVAAAWVTFAVLVTHGVGAPFAVYLALILAFYSLGVHSSGSRPLVAGATALSALVVADLVHGGLFNGSGRSRPAAWLAFSLAWLVGREVRRRRQRVLELEERAARLARDHEETARLAMSEERSRIARELHDVVAHAVSVMVVQAEAGAHLLGDPGRAGAAFGAIEATGRDALAELRRLLGILRSSDEQLAIGPQPGLESLRSLVEQLNGSARSVALRIEGVPVHLPAGVDLAAYRIVQEALTNVVKHAGADAAAEVVISYRTGALELSVVDDGYAAATNGNGSGHGLIGMRERVALYGGTLTVREGETGGYAVSARLPLVTQT